MGEHGFSCDKCPRTFKLEEFFEKHKKVHELKKQHVCEVCGFVYGAAKGLEGHLKTHSDDEILAASSKGSPKRDEENNPPYSMDFRYLQPFGVLTSGQAKPPAPRSEKSSSTETEDLKVSPHGGTGSYEIYGKSIKIQNYFFKCNLLGSLQAKNGIKLQSQAFTQNFFLVFRFGTRYE